MKPNLQEPPIKEQMGLTTARQSRKFKKGRAVRRHERPELFNAKIMVLRGFEIWITPFNRIFLADAQTGDVGYPRLLDDNALFFEPSLPGVPEDVLAALAKLLSKQKAIRRKMVEFGEYDEDDGRWDWST